MALDESGPAFPAPALNQGRAFEQSATQGMTLRDWFAGMALQGLVPADDSMASRGVYANDARHAYGLADAMLAERQGEDT